MSLTHLKQFPVDLMKIDRSFIWQIGTDTGNTAIARAVEAFVAGLCREMRSERKQLAS